MCVSMHTKIHTKFLQRKKENDEILIVGRIGNHLHYSIIAILMGSIFNNHLRSETPDPLSKMARSRLKKQKLG